MKREIVFLMLIMLCLPAFAIEISTPEIKDFGLLEQIKYVFGQWLKPMAVVEVTPPYPKVGQAIEVAYVTDKMCQAWSSTPNQFQFCTEKAGWYVCPFGKMVVTVRDRSNNSVVATKTFSASQIGVSKTALVNAFQEKSGYWYCTGGTSKLVTFTVSGLTQTGQYKVTAEGYTAQGTSLDYRLDSGYDYIEVLAACTEGQVICWDGKIQECVGGAYGVKEVCTYGCVQNSTTGECDPGTGESQSIAGKMCYANEKNEYRCDVQTANRVNKCTYNAAGNWYRWDYQQYCPDGCSGGECNDLPAVCGDGECNIGKYESVRANAAWCPADCGGLTNSDCYSSPSKHFYALGSIAINGGKACACPPGKEYAVQGGVPKCVVGGPQTECGNGNCEIGENVENCPLDCGSQAECGDGTCEGDETVDSCPEDCTPGTTCDDAGYFSEPQPEWQKYEEIDLGNGLICYIEGHYECEDVVFGDCTSNEPVECSGTSEIGTRFYEVFDLETCETIDAGNEPCEIGITDKCAESGCGEKSCTLWEDDKCINGVMKESRLCTTYVGEDCESKEKIENRLNTEKTCEVGIVIPSYVYLVIAGFVITIVLGTVYMRRRRK